MLILIGAAILFAGHSYTWASLPRAHNTCTLVLLLIYMYMYINNIHQWPRFFTLYKHNLPIILANHIYYNVIEYVIQSLVKIATCLRRLSCFFKVKSWYILEKITLPSASLSISIVPFSSLTPVSVTGRERLGGVVLLESATSVITRHGGSPVPLYPSTAALSTWKIIITVHSECAITII